MVGADGTPAARFSPKQHPMEMEETILRLLDEKEAREAGGS